MRDAGNKANISGPIPQIRQFADWLQASRDLKFAEYEDMWRWSVTDIDAFWQSIWDYHRIESPTAFVAVLNEETMPGARWFEGARVNYAQQVFRHAGLADAAGQPAIVAENERGETAALRAEERRVGKDGGRGGRSRWAP